MINVYLRLLLLQDIRSLEVFRFRTSGPQRSRPLCNLHSTLCLSNSARSRERIRLVTITAQWISVIADNVASSEIRRLAQDFGGHAILKPPNTAMMTLAIRGSLESFLLIFPARGTSSTLISSTTEQARTVYTMTFNPHRMGWLASSKENHKVRKEIHTPLHMQPLFLLGMPVERIYIYIYKIKAVALDDSKSFEAHCFFSLAVVLTVLKASLRTKLFLSQPSAI